MSTQTIGHPDMHEHGAALADHESHDGPHGTLRDYLVGFTLSVVLTAIPFWLVMGSVLPSKQVAGFVIMAFAVAQIFVHMVYFLHMNAKSEQGWTLVALLFTLVLVVIALAGSLWVMNHLNTNMMPGAQMNQDTSQVP
jgi:cytochrome o ubiquinol oxidase operon protein cyoD